jgi:hypothetical protein
LCAHRIWQENCDWVEFLLISFPYFQAPRLWTPKSAYGTIYGDRFIPSRAGNSWQTKFAMITVSVFTDLCFFTSKLWLHKSNDWMSLYALLRARKINFQDSALRYVNAPSYTELVCTQLTAICTVQKIIKWSSWGHEK